MAWELLPQNPHRPVDWRWLRAQECRDNYSHPRLKYSRKSDGPLIGKAIRFLQALDKVEDDVDLHVLAMDHPEMFWAHQLHDEEKHSNRWEVEARILAGDGLDVISGRTGLPEAAIELYEALFFNVNERLKIKGYILHTVLGPSVHKGLTDRDHDLLWKLYGYFGGGVVLDQLIDQFNATARPERLDDNPAFWNDDAHQLFDMKTALAIRTLRFSGFGAQLEILDRYLKWKEIEKSADGTGGAGDLILNNIEIMLGGLPWQVGDTRKADEGEILAAPPSGELNPHELMLLSSGQDLGEVKMLEVFPEPVK